MPSKVVYIKQSVTIVHEQVKSDAAREYLSNTRKAIGSYFFSQYSTKKGTGLTDEEVKLLLPQIIDIHSQDPSFKAAVDRFYTEINTVIPYDKGRAFEIGLQINDKEPVSINNLPINIEDYVRFRHAKTHPEVATNPDAAKGQKIFKFYVEDPEQVLNSKYAASDVADEAIAVYATIKDNPEKLRMIFTLLRHELPRRKEGEPPLVIDNLDDKSIALQLREKLVTIKPEKFLAVAKDENLTRQYLVDDMITLGMLKRISSTIFITESDEAIGTNIDEAVKILWSQEKSQVLNGLRAQYKEKKRRQQEARLAKA